MGQKIDAVDEYIANAADFARPILTHLRDVVHKACPEAVEEIKWGFPHFMYKGMLCSMAAFKAHMAFGFWKGELLLDRMGDAGSREAMGHFGRITAKADLPPAKKITEWIKIAMTLNDDGVKAPNRQKKPAAQKTLTVPDCLLAALKKNKKAAATFEAFSYSHRKEYVEWINEAKTEPTREKRLLQTIEWLAEGKSRNWKYNCR